MRACTLDSAVTGVIVRRASPSDLDALLSLYRTLAGEKRSALPADPPNALGILREVLSQPSRHLLVAEVDGELAGTADMLIVSNLTHHGMPWAIVENVIVAEQHRRRGVARRLLESLIETARAAGCCKLELISGKHRTGAHAFYRSVGMEAVAEGFKLYYDE